MADSGSAMASASAAVSIGNYKGVMLCNRPFNGVSTTLAKESRSNSNIASSTTKLAFLAGIPIEPLGMNVTIHTDPPHAVKRDKKNTALSKHKKWLHDLQKERERLQRELDQDDDKQQQRRDRFSEREAKFREAVRSNSNAPEADGSEDAGEMDRKADAKKLRRPMWALTKETADEKRAQLEADEADELIDFANNLDMDQFMDDVEMKARVAQVEQQLAQLQTIVDHEEAEEKRQQWLGDKASSPSGPLTGNDLLRWKAAHGDGDDEGDDDDDARSVASSVLSECKSLRSVHSVRSVTAMAKRVEAKLLQPEDGVVNPRVVTIDEEQGARMQIKTLASNLPYIHRNPAI